MKEYGPFREAKTCQSLLPRICVSLTCDGAICLEVLWIVVHYVAAHIATLQLNVHLTWHWWALGGPRIFMGWFDKLQSSLLCPHEFRWAATDLVQFGWPYAKTCQKHVSKIWGHGRCEPLLNAEERGYPNLPTVAPSPFFQEADKLLPLWCCWHLFPLLDRLPGLSSCWRLVLDHGVLWSLFVGTQIPVIHSLRCASYERCIAVCVKEFPTLPAATLNRTFEETSRQKQKLAKMLLSLITFQNELWCSLRQEAINVQSLSNALINCCTTTYASKLLF